MNERAKTIKAALKPLSEKHAQFVMRYLQHFNASAAYREVGYSPKGAYQGGSTLLRKPKVHQAIATLLRVLGITRDRLMSAHASIAFADLAELEPVVTGKKTLTQARDEGIDTSLVKKITIADTEFGKRRTIEMYDRQKALGDLTRVLGMFQDNVNHTGVSIELNITLTDDEVEEAPPVDQPKPNDMELTP